MTAKLLFPFANYLAMLGWILLIFVPKWKLTKYISGFAIMLMIAVLYVYLMISSWGVTDGGFGSLEEVRRLFENDKSLLAGWVHYLAFDLFLGTWIVHHAQKHSIHHLLIIPALILTFMAGPAGVLLYWLIYLAAKKKQKELSLF
ncbi:protein of unknown function [Marivirga sericea]|uniref:DUF4281 domain-containing protein n=1 Tax=Marivirga sericea TaxID=1028 RepID=A0A1X7KLN5_9BACT|nr:ABA4-like family protein [Marivirga sericea]SMG42053.1 protein of unknown function [Marivirga sericea]